MRRTASFLILLAATTSCTRTTEAPRVPTTIVITNGDGQTAIVGTPLTVQPEVTVKDQTGSPMPGTPILVEVNAGGGTLAGAPTVTSSSGTTAVGIWTMGHAPATNILSVSAGTKRVLIVATAVAGSATKVVLKSGNTVLNGTVGFSISTNLVLQMTDAFDNPVQGVTPTVVASNGGSVGFATAFTDFNGNITINRWSLGGLAGTQTLSISVGGSTPIVVQATVRAGAVAFLTPNVTLPLTGLPGAPTVPLAVSASDNFGNPVSGVPVTFAVQFGGGSISGALTATTNAAGVATGGTWNFGRNFGTQRVIVTSGGISTFITGTTSSLYLASVRYITPPDAATIGAVQAALDRLRVAVVGRYGDLDVNALDLAATCGVTGGGVITETIRDIVFYVQVQALDGPGGVVVLPNFCVNRTNGLGVVVSITIDDADLGTAIADGSLTPRILHEMVRGLGFGGAWFANALITGMGGADPRFTGANAATAFATAGGTSAGGVPVENLGGVGVQDVNWRSVAFVDELMAGAFVVGQARPFSNITLQSLKDLGFTVSQYGADAFTFPGPALRARP